MTDRATAPDPASPVTRAVDGFRARFPGEPRVFFAPGRLNIIGEHTDYSGGLAMPAAIDRGCAIAIAPAPGGRGEMLALDYDASAPFPEHFSARADWSDYVAGCQAVLAEEGAAAPPCNMAIASSVPQGLGVSSSAALEVAALLALSAMTERSFPPLKLATLAQAAENRYVGVPCGILDPYASLHGREGYALHLDCRALNHEYVAIPPGAVFLIVDSNVRRRLRDGGYAQRRTECENARRILGLASLREADEADLVSAGLSSPEFRRARHVIRENARVSLMRSALETGALAHAGELMNASHESLKTDFDVTCEETDALAAALASMDGVFGARQMGGGFGGAVIALAEEDAAGEAIRRCGRIGFPAALACRASGGAREVAA